MNHPRAARRALVPNVQNSYLSEAIELVYRSALRAQVPDPPELLAHDTRNGYVVAEQAPEAGTEVERGSVVSLTVVGSVHWGSISQYVDLPDEVRVPDFRGLPLDAAISQAQVALLAPGVPRPPALPAADEPQTYVVEAQEPPPGTRCPPWSALLLTANVTAARQARRRTARRA
jgi:beta-lactam-binding protein with PASTA domain